MPRTEQRPDWGATTPRLLLAALVRLVRGRFRWLGQARIEDAVMEAIERQMVEDKDSLRDADKAIEAAVMDSLYDRACHIVRNGIRADRRRGRRECEYARREKFCCEEDFFVANGLSAEHISIEEQLDKLKRLLECFHPWERDFVRLHLQGCRDRTAYVKLLSMEECPVEEQRQAVKRTWDCLLKKLRRRTRLPSCFGGQP